MPNSGTDPQGTATLHRLRPPLRAGARDTTGTRLRHSTDRLRADHQRRKDRGLSFKQGGMSPRKLTGPCPSTGCPNRAGQCADHARGTRQQRGYDADYDAQGRAYQRRMDSGERFTCWRCRRPITGTLRGRDWTLGHDDIDRSIIHGPEHPACNYATSTRRGGG